MPQIVTDITIEAYMGTSAAQRKHVQNVSGQAKKTCAVDEVF